MLVVGGGITGAGVALDAASRGLRTALVEKGDFASGTSSKSSKMIHGGIRYLQQREFRLVYENLAERQRLLDNAPHLVTPAPVPHPPLRPRRRRLQDAWPARTPPPCGSTTSRAAGASASATARSTKDEALAHLPTLSTDHLVAGFLYFDARADDARLTLTVARTAALDYGAVVANYTPVVRLTTGADGHGRRRRGAPGARTTRPRSSRSGPGRGQRHRRLGRRGAGPRRGPAIPTPSARPRASTSPCRPTGFPCDIAAVIPVPKDKRSIFVVSWPGRTSSTSGTTDTDYDGPARRPRLHPRGRRLPARRGQRRHHLAPRPGPTSPASGPACGPCWRRRPRAATSPSARPTCPAATPSARRPTAWSPSPAASSRPTARWPRTPSTPSCTRLGESPAPPALRDQVASRCIGRHRPGRRDPVDARPSRTPRLLGRYGTESPASPGPGRRTPRAARAAGRRAALHRRRGALRGARGDGRHARRRADRRTRAIDPARPGRPWTPPPPSPPSSRPTWAGTSADGAPSRSARFTDGRARRNCCTRRARPRRDRAHAGHPHRRRPAADVADRLGARVVEVPPALLDRLAASGAEVVTDDDARAEAGRDWWPLAIGWAADGAVPHRPAVVVRPDSTRSRWRPCWPPATRRAVPVTAAAGRSGVCGGSIPVFGGVALDLTALDGLGRRRRDLADGRRAGRHLRPGPRGRAAARSATGSRSATGPSRWTSRPSAAGWPAGGRASTRPATGRSRTWSSASRWCWPTAASSAPRATGPAPPPGPT